MVDFVAVGQRLKARRLQLDLSQEAVARAVNVTPSFYGNIERGLRVPSVETIVALATELQVTLDYLFGRNLPEATQKDPKDASLYKQFFRDLALEMGYGSEYDTEVLMDLLRKASWKLSPDTEGKDRGEASRRPVRAELDYEK